MKGKLSWLITYVSRYCSYHVHCFLFQSLGLLINLVEHCDLNRVKLLEMSTSPAYENSTEIKATDAVLSLVEVCQ